MPDCYRENLYKHKDENKQDYFEYYITNSPYINNGICTGYYCPVCKTLNSHYSSTTKHCYPTKKVIIKGFWFWRKYCPLDCGKHTHIICNTCEAHFIYIEPKYVKPESHIKYF